MYDVDDGHRQRGGDVEEGDGQQHQSRCRFRRLVVLLWLSRARQLPTTSPAGGEETSDDEYVEDDGDQRCHKVERHLGRPDVDFHGLCQRSLVTLSRDVVVRVDVRVERGDQRASGDHSRSDLYTTAVTYVKAWPIF